MILVGFALALGCAGRSTSAPTRREAPPPADAWPGVTRADAPADARSGVTRADAPADAWPGASAPSPGASDEDTWPGASDPDGVTRAEPPAPAGVALRLQFRSLREPRIGDVPRLQLVARDELPMGQRVDVVAVLRRPDGTSERARLTLESRVEEVFRGCDPARGHPDSCKGGPYHRVAAPFRAIAVVFFDARRRTVVFDQRGRYVLTLESPDGRAHAPPLEIDIR